MKSPQFAEFEHAIEGIEATETAKRTAVDAGQQLYSGAIREWNDHFLRQAEGLARSHPDDQELAARLALFRRLLLDVQNEGEHLPLRFVQGMAPETLEGVSEIVAEAAAVPVVEAATDAVTKLVEPKLLDRLEPIIMAQVVDKVAARIASVQPGLVEDVIERSSQALLVRAEGRATVVAGEMVPKLFDSLVEEWSRRRRWFKPWTWRR